MYGAGQEAPFEPSPSSIPANSWKRIHAGDYKGSAAQFHHSGRALLGVKYSVEADTLITARRGRRRLSNDPFDRGEPVSASRSPSSASPRLCFAFIARESRHASFPIDS